MTNGQLAMRSPQIPVFFFTVSALLDNCIARKLRIVWKRKHAKGYSHRHRRGHLVVRFATVPQASGSIPCVAWHSQKGESPVRFLLLSFLVGMRASLLIVSGVLLLFTWQVAEVAASSNFLCQGTINTYNEYVNVGQFETAANLTFTDDVQYIIPGPIDGPCPYCGTYNGKQAVVSLFVDGFLGHFTIVNPLVNLRQIDTGASTSPAPRLLDFNQESFVTKPSKTKGGVGRYFSVPVIHDFRFDASTCKISQMVLYQDPYTVTRVYAGHPSTAAPVMPFVVFNAPPTTFFSVANVTDFQVFPQEETVDAAAAKALARRYYDEVRKGNGTLSPNATATLFMKLDYAIPQAVAAYIVPGDASVLPYAGMFLDVDQVTQAHELRKATVVEASPMDSSNLVWIVDKGSVAVQYRLRGRSVKTGKRYDCAAVDYFQVFPAGADGLRIGRLTRFFDTYNVTMALSAS